MFSVIFEVHPKQEKFDLYLELAKGLRPILQGIDGFIDNERFESTLRRGWILSHSTWRDEKSVIRWRTVGKHHDIQQRGRDEVFQDYHLRVGEIVAESRRTADGNSSLCERSAIEVEEALPRSFTTKSARVRESEFVEAKRTQEGNLFSSIGMSTIRFPIRIVKIACFQSMPPAISDEASMYVVTSIDMENHSAM